MLRRGSLASGAFLSLLLDRGSSASAAAAAAASLSTPLPPHRHFFERVLGGTGSLSSVAAPGAAGARCDPLIIHFLCNSCGLAEPEAKATAARLHLRSTKNAHTVLAHLRDIGLAPDAIARLIVACPTVLSSKNIGAKLDFYRQELGLSDDHVRRIFLASPYRAVRGGLDSWLRPNHQILKDLLGSDTNVRVAVQRYKSLILENLQLVLLPKLQILRDHGVPEEAIVKLVSTHPVVLVHRSPRFNEGLAALKNIGVSPSSGIFPHALGVFAKIHQSKWDRKLENFLSLSWTKEQVWKAFARHPYCMSVSEDKARQLMKFFADELGWTPEDVSACPTLLSFSYEKRILPRCTVLKMLASKGAPVIKQGIKMGHLTMSEKDFVERYITTYQQAIPQVLEAYGARRTSVGK